MTAPPLERAIAEARFRRAAIGLLLAVPIVAGAAAVAWRITGPIAAVTAALVVVVAAATAVVADRRRTGRRQFIRRLDADPANEDSADLLFADASTLGPLQRLQRERLLARIRDVPPSLLPAWPRRALAATSLAGTAMVALALAWPPATQEGGTAARRPAGTAGTPTHTTLVAATLAITPPAYTGLTASTQPDLSAKVPVGTRLAWSLRLSPEPTAVELQLHDGGTVALVRDGDAWVGEHVLARPLLYRIVVRDGLPLADDARHRLDAVADQPPRLRVIAPERSLTLRTAGQRGWPLQFEASDDYGLGGARLKVTLALGSGEQVTISGRTLAIRGVGDATSRRYATTLDPGALGLTEGGDLIVRLEVDDNRAPAPQRSRTPSLILRWLPPASTESTGMEGLVKRALPAYFRSQRQIIIDAEALVAERPRTPAERFADRSDSLGVDQRILRMRYGEFLGEENAGQPDAAGHEEHDDEPPAAFGTAIDALEEYGHTHDDAEAATLLDPETRALLKKALDAMWSSEGELRQARPEQALPHAYRALGYIKQVQQATRVYLARVGLELPAIDPARRMTGVRDGIGDRRDGLRAAETSDSPPRDLWQALGNGFASVPVDADAADGDPLAGSAIPRTEAAFSAFEAWMRANEARVEDPLDVLAAVEEARARPDCAACRERLRARLWPLLPRPVAASAARPAPDAEGRAYLDALGAADDTGAGE